MADSISTPRLTSPYLDSFTSKTIRLIGRVTQLRGDTATIDSDGNVTVQLNHESHLKVGNCCEIIGRVNQDLSVKVLKATDLGIDVDMGLVSAVVDATHRYKEIFYTD